MSVDLFTFIRSCESSTLFLIFLLSFIFFETCSMNLDQNFFFGATCEDTDFIIFSSESEDILPLLHVYVDAGWGPTDLNVRMPVDRHVGRLSTQHLDQTKIPRLSAEQSFL